MPTMPSLSMKQVSRSLLQRCELLMLSNARHCCVCPQLHRTPLLDVLVVSRLLLGLLRDLLVHDLRVALMLVVRRLCFHVLRYTTWRVRCGHLGTTMHEHATAARGMLQAVLMLTSENCMEMHIVEIVEKSVRWQAVAQTLKAVAVDVRHPALEEVASLVVGGQPRWLAA
jgi:hypothetical protein